MRIVDEREVIVVDEQLESLQPLASHLSEVQHLNVAFNAITSIAGSEQAAQLRVLNVSHNAIASLWEVAPLASLRVLKCSYNDIADLSWLAGLRSLRELWATHNRIESAQIAHLRSLNQLGTLVLHPNPCTESLSYVALPWLERLDTVVGEVMEIAEEFMRNFPVQDYIPIEEQQQRESSSTNQATSVDPKAPEQELPDAGPEAEEAPQLALPPEPSLSSIASAVLSLPTFSSDGFLKRHAPKPKAAPAAVRKKSLAARARGSSGAASPSAKLLAAADLSSFKQDEWLLAYPNSTVTAVHVRSDGSAIAKWPSGSIAVSVDRERDGFRVYAAHRDGQIALSFDSAGVGFINYHPSGKMMISTTSSGDGLYFSSDGFSILRQWDADLNIKDERSEPTDALGDEVDGSLLCKLSDGVGVRVQLAEPSAGISEAGSAPTMRRSSPIQLSVYFATTSGIRFQFANSINRSPRAGEQQSDECACVFGKQQAPKREEPSKSPPIPHADLLSDIRAAVAGLQL
ncbi:hypothetical protein PybrP1_012375 [[Pythium] brassicae (nom. inval.)]|nr:hypothetical protein PybrP1_012375 [[Pythium] brassicae (nom. inval.)]